MISVIRAVIDLYRWLTEEVREGHYGYYPMPRWKRKLGFKFKKVNSDEDS